MYMKQSLTSGICNFSLIVKMLAVANASRLRETDGVYIGSLDFAQCKSIWLKWN